MVGGGFSTSYYEVVISHGWTKEVTVVTGRSLSFSIQHSKIM